MLALYGQGVSSGISIGPAYVLQRERPETPEYVLPQHLLADEAERFRAAVARTRAQLKEIRAHIPADAPAETASFIDTHLLILDDKMISHAPIDMIFEGQYNAEWALKIQSDLLLGVFEKMEDPYLRNRKTDVMQVVDRVLRNLLNPEQEESTAIAVDLSGHVIVASDLAPADTVLLKHKNICAFVTNLGGPISHTAILARSLGIPAVVGAHGATAYIRNGETVIVDGKRGAIVVGADEASIADYRQRQKDIARFRRELDALKAAEPITSDGERVELFANIELPEDIRLVERVAAPGIGLYRTEFLFMNRREPPDEEEQFHAYVRVVKALRDRPVTIRTLDLGADKQVDGGNALGNSSALGLRAVRLCLHDTSFFKPQLRAILRASVYGRVRMMIPMLTNLDEVARVQELVKEAKAELRQAGVAFDDAMPVGGMIEVPAAAVAADLFAAHLDFLSIGTNDLIQYTLAIDRVDNSVSYLYDPLHPAVLRLIGTTIAAGRAANIPVAMCGEMAGDPRYTKLLLGMGLKEFSMHPSALLEIKKLVRESSHADLARFAAAALRIGDTQELHAWVEARNERKEPARTSLP